jgi:Zn-dependent protease
MMGWASAPYDVDWSRRYPHRAAKMSFAGPLANFTLAAIAAIGIHVGLWTGFFTLPDSVSFTHVAEAATPGIAEAHAELLGYFFSLNVFLGCFNLLPIPPLDGFCVLGLLVSEERARRLQDFGHSLRSFAYVGLLLGWRVFDGVYEPVLIASIRALYPSAHYQF